MPRVNSLVQTREELLDNLRDAQNGALGFNRAEVQAVASGAYEEVSLAS